MGNVAVKICGLQSTGMLESMLNLPIDYIGFVFAKSRRQVSPSQAKEMIDFLHKHKERAFMTAGVFVNPTQDELIRVMSEAPLDVIQLHGRETPDFCKWVRSTFKVKLFKVFSIAAGERIDKCVVDSILDPYLGVIDTVMLDTYDAAVGGGTGKPFSWEFIPLFHSWTNKFSLPLIIAGGLNADNVKQLISEYQPDGVDVSSGVETNGVKDIHKIISFVEGVGGLR
ncbi:MAG TPA: phosphoribosylanthranilate isomerase [Bacilli bacterium]